MTLLDDIKAGEAVTAGERECPLCTYIEGVVDHATADALTRAAAGTMGIKRLAAVLAKHETGIGRRTITRHRDEGHQA